jgi:hypothetical protein
LALIRQLLVCRGCFVYLGSSTTSLLNNHLVRGWQLDSAVEFSVKYEAGLRRTQERPVGNYIVNPGENTQSHHNMKFAVRVVRHAIAGGQVPNLLRIAKRIDQYRAELHAKGLSKAKQATQE